jgi:hypothetical protein
MERNVMGGMCMEQNEHADYEDIGDFGEAAVYRAFHRMGYQVYLIKEKFEIYNKYLKDISKDRFFGLDVNIEGKHRHIAVQVKTKQPRICGNDTGMDEYQWNRLVRIDESATFPFIMVLFVERAESPDIKTDTVVWRLKDIYGDWVARMKNTIWESHYIRRGTKTDIYQPGKCDAWNNRDNLWMVYWRVKDMRPLNDLLSTLNGYGFTD